MHYIGHRNVKKLKRLLPKSMQHIGLCKAGGEILLPFGVKLVWRKARWAIKSYAQGDVDYIQFIKWLDGCKM
jgi:hypothetical protein